MGFFSNKNKRREELLHAANAIKDRLNKNLKFLEQRSVEEQMAVCIGSAKFEMVLMARYGTIKRMMLASEEEKHDFARKMSAFMKTQEGDLLLWIGFDIGFAWYGAVDISMELGNQQEFVDDVRRVFEEFAKRGRGFEGIAPGGGFLDT